MKNQCPARPASGTRIRLLSMDDPQAPPPLTEGVVDYVDDVGTIHMHWDNGSSLGLIPGTDRWMVLKAPEHEEE